VAAGRWSERGEKRHDDFTTESESQEKNNFLFRPELQTVDLFKLTAASVE
jgi:hypothetical protein